MQQGRFGDWGGAEGCAHGRACSGDAERIEYASWWSQYGAGAPELQRCALRVMHMWSYASPAEKNWAVHEGIHTKKCNQLTFEKVVQLVEITANVRLTEYRRAGRGYVLSWQRDEGMLDCQQGRGLHAGTNRTEARMTTPAPTRPESSMPPPPTPSLAPPSPVSPHEPATAAVDTKALASSLPQHGLLQRPVVIRRLRLRSPSPGMLWEEGVPSAAPVEGELAAAERDVVAAAAVEGEVAAVEGEVAPMEEEIAAATEEKVASTTTVEGEAAAAEEEIAAATQVQNVAM
ncbi:hypothetical protein CBR_g20127 [Chara braunii]|uniref:HAT C-terminal dimerisation domain-containing protein n=1 Tax=Chara braunii TaxID=69332 RepID=A0A388KZL5_CHABU|nr:hypothetical protein CBR_g20127 [Chara braunii]|eukprot:GBG75496.1 hypothetical protein CBR_g20127 [Chara braunii]